MRIPHTNDGSTNDPCLKVYLNRDNLVDLGQNTEWCGAVGLDRLLSLKKEGFEGIQQYLFDPLDDSRPLPVCSLARINTAAESDSVVAPYADKGFDCLTVHAGWGVEDDLPLYALVEAILKSSEKYRIPIYIETHRATITRDIWRTVQITKKFPEVRFNGDLSHYYCGQELVYGGLEMKLEFMAPIFDRISFIHARIASPGCIQASIGREEERPIFATGAINYLADFKTMWTRAMRGWLKNAKQGDYLIFCPELLSREHYYAKTFLDSEGNFQEESDRYAEAKRYIRIAHECFSKAKESGLFASV